MKKDFTILVTRQIPEPGIQILRKNFKNVIVNTKDRNLTREELLKSVKGIDALLCLLNDRIDAEVIANMDKCKVISNYAVGFNNIDVESATKRGIVVTNTPGVLTDATADLTWALILAVTRRIVEADKFVRKGKFKGWAPMLMLGMELAGKTLGIIGAGRIGTAVGLRAKGFKMKVIYFNTNRNEILEEEVGAKKSFTSNTSQKFRHCHDSCSINSENKAFDRRKRVKTDEENCVFDKHFKRRSC